MTGACDCVSVYGFSFGAGERFLFSPEPSIFSIPLMEGKLVDLKISMDKLWILKEVGSMLYEECSMAVIRHFMSVRSASCGKHSGKWLGTFTTTKEPTTTLRPLWSPSIHLSMSISVSSMKFLT